jgi:hypothetical protein
MQPPRRKGRQERQVKKKLLMHNKTSYSLCLDGLGGLGVLAVN